MTPEGSKAGVLNLLLPACAGSSLPAGFDCENCGYPYDPIGYRWKCPHCSWKAHCCEGAPL